MHPPSIRTSEPGQKKMRDFIFCLAAVTQTYTCVHTHVAHYYTCVQCTLYTVCDMYMHVHCIRLKHIHMNMYL